MCVLYILYKAGLRKEGRWVERWNKEGGLGGRGGWIEGLAWLATSLIRRLSQSCGAAAWLLHHHRGELPGCSTTTGGNCLIFYAFLHSFIIEYREICVEEEEARR